VNALCTITAIAATHFVIAWLKNRSSGLGRVVDGTPMVLLEKGMWRRETMRRMHIREQDVMAAARDNAVERLNQIEYAILERNGEISVIEVSKKE
jgi:uncharacterized membrane protein YcaP (DUF421 family)